MRHVYIGVIAILLLADISYASADTSTPTPMRTPGVSNSGAADAPVATPAKGGGDPQEKDRKGLAAHDNGTRYNYSY